MPRIKSKAKDYAKSEFQAWIRQKMRENNIRMADLAKVYGITSQAVSYKIAHMCFSYMELMELFRYLGCERERIVYFMTGEH